MKKIKNFSLVDIVLILSPIIDVIICMLQKFTSIALLGTFLRGSLLAGLLIYIFFIKKEYDKGIFRYIIALLLYAYIFIFNSFIVNNGIVINEVIGLIKYLFYPLVLSALLIVKNKNKENVYNSLYISGIIYAFFLLVPMILKLNFKSYSSIKVGNIGWFFSANEISSIVSILCPFIIIKLYESKKIISKIIYFIIASLYIFSIFTIGTKTVIVSAFITLILLLIKNIYNLIKKHDKVSPLYTLLLIAFTILCFLKSSSLQNIIVQEKTFDISDIAKRDSTKVSTKETNSIANNNYKIMYDFRDEPIYITNKYLNLLFSSRDVFLMEHISSYKKVGLQEKLFGMGQIINEKTSATSKLVEIDFFDVFFNYGIVGFLVYFSFIAYLLFLIIKYFFKNIKEVFDNTKLFALYISLLISIMLSCFAGHILGAPSVSLIVAIIVSTLGDKSIKFYIVKFNLITKKNLLKIIVSLLLLIFIVFGINKISNAEDISNTINIKFVNHSIIIEDKNYEVKKISEKEIVGDYATDKLSFYNVFSKRKSIVKLLVVNREFNDSNIKIDFITGKNYTKNNVLLKMINEEDTYMDAYIYDLINVNYDGINHSIVKDLSDVVNLNKNSEIILKNEQYFDTFIINNNEYKYDDDSWLSFDGRYSLSKDVTIPSGKNIYVRSVYNDVEESILNDFKETNSELSKVLVDSYIHSLVNYMPRYKDSVWLTEYTNSDLSKIGINALYVKINDNIKLASYFKTHYDAKVKKLSNIIGEYLATQEKNKYVLELDNVKIPFDYYNNNSTMSRVSLENILDITIYLLKSDILNDRKLGLSYLKLINNNWIKDNGNFYSYMDSKGFYNGEDNDLLILDKLLSIEKITTDFSSKRMINNMILNKLEYLKSINYSLEGYVLDKLKECGYIE